MFPSFCYSRPATSFRWFTSPLKTLRYIIWRNYKWIIIGVLITLLIVAAIVIFLYSMPVSMMFVNSWAVWTPGLVNQSQIYGSGQCIEIEKQGYSYNSSSSSPIKCGGENGGKTCGTCGFYAHLIGWFRKTKFSKRPCEPKCLNKFCGVFRHNGL